MIMNETQKPFACSEKDCEMTFVNEDHLNWHQKKHDMMLNLGLAKNDVADQTPTPTRFIRNCEEVGLFQDLQNVNPFDEFFKKAIELTKSGGTLDVPETNSDDTLHTPHILPHVEENQKNIGNVNASQDDNNSRSNEFSLNTVIPIEHICTNETEKESSTEIIIIDDDDNDHNNGKDIKTKIKEALQSKGKHKKEKENHRSISGNSISVVPLRNLTIEKEKNKNVNKNMFIDESREKIREMNRAAQIRCRKRKQIRWKEMEEEIRILKNENKRLKLENLNLQRQLLNVKKKLDSKVSAIPTAIPVLSEVLPKLNAVNPVVIQIVPSDSNLVVPLSKTLSPLKIENVQSTSKKSLSSNDCQQKKFKKNLRKIIPKIIIEN